MKRSVWLRMLSMLLAFSLVLSMAPFGYAMEELMITEELPAAEGTVPVVETAPAEETVEATEAPEEENLPEETVAPETEPAVTEPEATEAEETEPEETEPQETEPEETEALEASGVITAMPDGYVLTEDQLEEKEKLNGTAQTVSSLIPGEDYVENEVILAAEDPAYARTVAQAYGGTLTGCEYGVAVVQLQGVTVVEALEAAEDMGNNLPAVHPNYITHVEPVENGDVSAAAANAHDGLTWEDWVWEIMTNPDPYLLDPVGKAAPFQWMHDMVNSYQAWGVTTGNPAVKVAVLDSGVQANHPELSGKVTSYNAGIGTSDEDGHGTHVAGIIAASMNNGRGGAGIAPNVSIMNVRVLDAQGRGTTDTLIRAINIAVANGAWIINMSLGAMRYESMVEDAIQNALRSGVTVIAAAGNDGYNIMNYPAAYDGVIAVTAVDQTGSRVWFANYGGWVDVAAPGYEIISSTKGSSYEVYNGTSMAAPVVSGVAALYMSAYGRVSPAEMENALKKSAAKGNTSDLGAGIVDAAKLFGSVQMMPEYLILDENEDILFYNNYKNQTVPCESTLVLGFNTEAYYDTLGTFLYTTDGKTPAMKDGRIVNGTEYDSRTGIDLSQYAGKTVTIKFAYISGVGVVSKAVTLKIKVALSQKINSITIDGPDTLVAGKKGTYTAKILPEKANQGVNWYIVSRSGQNKAKIDNKGVLTTEANSSGSITIRAVSTVDSRKYRDFTVNVRTYNPVKSVTLTKDKHTMNVGQTFTLGVQAIVDTTNMIIPTDRFDLEWSSSSDKIATVNAKTGVVTAVGKGTATITCKILDGSNKTAKCRVTVNVPAAEIVITGQHILEPGKTVSFKANVYPATANNKKVTWLLSGQPYGVTITPGGKVTIPKTATTGREFYVLAQAMDGSGVVGSIKCRIENKCTNLWLSYQSSVGAHRVTRNGKGQMTGLTLYATSRTNGLYADNGLTTDNSAIVGLHFTGSNYQVFEFSSSNPRVADVVVDTRTGRPVVVGLSEGKAKITFTAADGSKKKAVLNVDVTIPVSGMSIQTDANRINYSLSGRDGVPIVAFGKSVKNKVAFADTYGVPTNQKVSWDFTVKEYSVYTGREIDDWTSWVRSNKLVTISNAGALSVKAGLANLWYNISGELKIAVTATAQDGTGQKATIEFYAIPKTTVLQIEKDRPWEKLDNGRRALTFICDQWGSFADASACAFTATSSNPELLGVEGIEPKYDANGNVISNTYICYLRRSRDDTQGTVKITIKSADGVKSDSITIKLMPNY